jgi:hypothetical protein
MTQTVVTRLMRGDQRAVASGKRKISRYAYGRQG